MKKFYSHLLFEEYRLSYEALALYRILFAAAYIVLLGVPSFTWMSQIAPYFFEPQTFNIARWLVSGIPSFGVLLLLDGIVLLTLVGILFGFRTKLMSWGLTLSLLIGYTIQYSLGKIDHTIILVVVPAIMSFSGWEKCFSLDARRVPRPVEGSPDGYVPFLMALVLGFGIFTASVPKLFGGWLLPDQSAVVYQFYARYYAFGGPAPLAPLFMGDIPAWAWKVGDYSAVLFEFLFFPAVLNKRVFQWFCGAAIVFHVANLLVLDIIFTSNLLVYLLFLRWSLVLHLARQYRLSDRLSSWPTYRNFLLVLALVVVQYYGCVYAFNTFIGEDSATLDLLMKPFAPLPKHWKGIVLVMIALTIVGWQALARTPAEARRAA